MPTSFNEGQAREEGSHRALHLRQQSYERTINELEGWCL